MDEFTQNAFLVSPDPATGEYVRMVPAGKKFRFDKEDSERVIVTEFFRRADIPDIHSYKGFRPLSDQVLVRPLRAGDRLRSTDLIRIPGTHDRGRLDNRLGTVLALGPGDPVAVKCEVCHGKGELGRAIFMDYCEACDGTGFLGKHERTSFEVAVGDTVLYAPRGWAEIEVAGESLIVVHEDQGILSVVDPDSILFAEDLTTKKKGPDWVK